MTTEETSFISVLLPGANVALFTKDPETREAFQALENDWRFARVRLESYDGDVEGAIKYYSSGTPHDLIIIQTDDTGSGFSDRLEALAGYLTEKTAAIVIGPVNDVNLYRKLVGMGVSDYLVKPVSTAMLAEDVSRTLIAQIGASDSRLIAVLGAKGGVGATTIAEALASSLAKDHGQKTFLLDAAGGWSTLSVGMGFDPSTTLREAVRAASEQNEDSFTRMIHKADDKLFILSSGGDVMLDDSVSPEHYENFLQYLMGQYPVVIVDLSGSPSGLKRTVLTRANLTLLVTTPLLPSVRAARTLLQEIKQLRGGSIDDVEVILNMQGFATKHEVPRAQINEGLERPMAAVIKFEPDVFVSVESEAGRLSAHKDGAEIVRDLVKTVQKLLSLSLENKAADGGKSGGIGALLTKLKVRS